MTELKAFFRCLAAHVKMEMMYRTHLVVGLVSQLTFSLLSIVFVGVFLPPGSNIQGWGFWEILFLLGLGDATFGLSAILVFRTFLVFDSAYVLQGELDTLLVAQAQLLDPVVGPVREPEALEVVHDRGLGVARRHA